MGLQAKVEFAIYSADKQAYLTREYGTHMWSPWAIDAQGFETLEGATEFIRRMGWENTTRAVHNGAYVVNLIS